MMMSDRTIHARAAGGGEVVRYDRAGKWYLENSPEGNRVGIKLDEAVFLAIQDGAEVFLGLRGGTRFDAMVHAERQPRSTRDVRTVQGEFRVSPELAREMAADAARHREDVAEALAAYGREAEETI